MGIFNDIAQKAMETTNKIAQKTTETTAKIATETKLKLKISQDKSEISGLHAEIGKNLYEKHLRQEDTIIPPDLLEICKNIDEIEAKIKETEQEILQLNKKETE